MSVLFFDSFDHYTNSNVDVIDFISKEYEVSFLYGQPHLLPGRHSDLALYLTYHNVDAYIKKTIPSTNEMTYFILGFQFKIIGSQTNTGFEITFSNPALTWEYNKISCDLKSFIFATESEISPTIHTITDEEWHHVEIKIFYPNSGTWELYVDGVLSGTWTPSSTIEWNNFLSFRVRSLGLESFAITSDASKGWFVDDFYLLDNVGTSYNNVLGTNVRIETLLPIQDTTIESTIKNATYGYQSQNNIPANDSQYIVATFNTNQKSTFEYENLTNINNIGAIKKANIITNGIDHWYNDFTFMKNNEEIGASISEESIDHALIGKNLNSIIFNKDPETNNNWERTVFNTNSFGFKCLQRFGASNNIQLTSVTDSMGDLYFPSFLNTDKKRFNSHAYVLMISSATLYNPNPSIWETVASGFSYHAGGYSRNYMVIKKVLSGLETSLNMAVDQSISNHSFALMCITSSANSYHYDTTAGIETTGSETFSTFSYSHNFDRQTILPIRIVAPITASSVNSTIMSGTELSDWVNFSSGLSFSKLYYLENEFRQSTEADTTVYGYGGTLTASLVAPSILVNMIIAK